MTQLPDRLAFASEHSRYTFAEADVRAGRIADRLTVPDPIAAGPAGAAPTGPGLPGEQAVPVGLLAGHDADGIVGLFGIWLAERIAVVLDPHLPDERLRQIVESAGLREVVADDTHRALAESLLGAGGRVLSLTAACTGTGHTGAAAGRNEPGAGRGGQRRRQAAGTGPAPRHGQDAAAIVYTSGSTGRPKGVIQTHGLLLNDVYANGERFRITPEDRAALVLPYGFAAGMSVLCTVVLNGAGVHTYDPRDKGVHRFAAWLREHRISTLHCSPHLVRSLVATLDAGEVLDSLRLVSTVGEAVYGNDVDELRPHLGPAASFFNWGGSSEMGTLGIFELRPGDEVPAGPVPLGRPIANKEVRLVRDDGTDAGAGEVGTVMVVSAYLSGGYWRDDESNALRFSLLGDGRRLCKQGDLGKMDGAGNLVLLGRSDSAVKVRGYLVEPSEVEAALLRLREVKDAVVVAVHNPPAPTRLVAYVVCDPEQRAPSAANLRRRLREGLPEYMVPPTIIQLERLPRTDRGKVDRRSLPVPQQERHSEPPSGQYEAALADIWCEVLGLETVGRDDDFIELGGDSLAVEEVLVLVQERLGVALRSSEMIGVLTLREFTRRVLVARESRLPSNPDAVALQAEGEKTPIHCFAGAGALALTFQSIARHLPGRRIYAYQAHGLERRGLPDRTVRAAACRDLETLRIVQPRGPYVLVGHSFGGLVALEIATMLAEAGEEVELVGLLDTYLPTSVASVDYDYARLSSHVSGSSDPGSHEPARHTPAHVRGGAGRWFRRLFPEGVPALGEWGRHARSYIAGAIQFTGQTQFDAFFDQLKRVARHHELRSYAGRTLLVLAQNNPDSEEAWRPFLAGPCDVVHIASEHSSLLREPRAAELAAILEAHLGEGAATASAADSRRPTPVTVPST